MRTSTKKALERILFGRGYALKEIGVSPRGLPLAAKHLAGLGFRPKTVIDVGVGNGTSWLYDAFPLAHFELFEPLDCFVPAMERICGEFNAEYHLCALGAEPGNAVIEVDPELPTGSTIAGRLAWSETTRSRVSERRSEHRAISVRTLDEFAPFVAPILLKLDVEGFESEVLKGARRTLADTEIIISEVSIARRHKNEMSFGAFMHFMENLGFSLVDIAELSSTSRDGSLAYIDGIFMRPDSRLAVRTRT